MISIKQVYRLSLCCTVLWCTSVKTAAELTDDGYMDGVFVFEDYWTSFVDEPATSFRKASEAFLDGDNDKSSRFIKKGIAFIKLEMSRSRKKKRSELSRIRKHLGMLSVSVKKNNVKQVAELHRLFAKAEFQIAVHHKNQISYYLKEKNNNSAGKSIEASLWHLRQAWIWADKYMPEKDGILLKPVQKTAHLLQAGSSISTKDTDETIGELPASIA